MTTTPPNEPPVGPGNPPKEHRWKKGCPSPNPNGRPCNAKKRQMMKKPEAFDEMFLRLGAKAAHTLTGEEITLAEAVLRKLLELALAKKSPNLKALQLVLGYYREVSAATDKLRSEAARAAWAYKEHMTARLEHARKTGQKIADPIPHPDDVIVTRDLDVRIMGPSNAEEYAALVQVMDYLDGAEKLVPGLKKGEEGAGPIARALRSRWITVNKALPSRLQKPWPGPSLQELKTW